MHKSDEYLIQNYIIVVPLFQFLSNDEVFYRQTATIFKTDTIN